MTGAERRSFQAAMALNYCGGSARQAARGLGGKRDTVELGLNERRTGVICLGGHSADSSGSLGTVVRSRFPGGVSAVAQHDGSGSTPEGLPPAQGREGYASQ